MPLFTVCLFIVYIIHTSHLVYLNLHFFTFQDFRWRFKGTDRLCKVVELSMHWKHMHTKVRFWTSTLRSNSGFTDPYKVLYVSNESKRICPQHCILSSTAVSVIYKRNFQFASVPSASTTLWKISFFYFNQFWRFKGYNCELNMQLWRWTVT